MVTRELVKASPNAASLQFLNAWCVWEMSPTAPSAQIVDGIKPNSGYFANLGIALPLKVKGPYLTNKAVGKFGVWLSFPEVTRLHSLLRFWRRSFAASLDAISYVIKLAPPTEMVRVAARRVIARVDGKRLTLWCRPMHKETRYA